MTGMGVGIAMTLSHSYEVGTVIIYILWVKKISPERLSNLSKVTQLASGRAQSQSSQSLLEWCNSVFFF